MQFEDYIKIPYTTIPRMYPYTGSLLNSSPSSIYLSEKRKEFILHNENIWFQSDLAYHHKLVRKACMVLGIDIEREITSLGLKIQEDIVIVHRGRLEAAFVAFPSGWKAGDKQGRTLQELHEPVADGNELRRMSNKITELMCGKNFYHRGVWTLTTSNKLSAYPDYVKPQVTDVNNLWFRFEHQITFPIEEGLSSGFLIDVQVFPFNTLSQNIKERIIASINSMSDALLSYKDLHNIKYILQEHGV